MIQVRLKGGMGNQMFQYAFGLGQAARLNTNLKLDCSALLDRARGEDFVYRDLDLDIFGVNPEFGLSPSLLRKVYKIKSSVLSRTVKKVASRNLTIVKEKHFHVDENIIETPTDNALYDGWWQSEHYFENVKNQVGQAFRFREEVLPESKELFSKIKSTNAVCLNVRRTDFLTTPTLNATNLEYFLKAARLMADLVQNPHFFVFSDDLAWCQENIRLDQPVELVTHHHKGRKFGNYLQLMTNCKHFIIPNSSFAWWAVWLNSNNDKVVVAPKNWFNDTSINTINLVPDSWNRL